jgi:hypothetical protein
MRNLIGVMLLARGKPKRNPLHDHLPRDEIVQQPANNGAWEIAGFL